MTIKHQGGIFGRNPTFNDVEVNSIGIGTPAPTAVDLEIKSSVPRLQLTDSDNSAYTQFLFNTGSFAVDVDPTASGGASKFTVDVDNVRQLELNSSGNLIVETGNLVIGTSGQGIDFSATSGTGTSELFDDYEEGTWTPTLSVESGTAPTHTVTEARYTKIGRQVHAYAKVNISAVGAGLLRCTFPFTPDSNQGIYGNARMKNSSNNWRHTMILGYSTSFFFFGYDDNATYYVNSSTLATGDISFTLTYNV